MTSPPNPTRRRRVLSLHIVKWLFGYVRPHRSLVFLTLLLLVLVSAAQLVQPIILKWAIDDAIATRQIVLAAEYLGIRAEIAARHGEPELAEASHRRALDVIGSAGSPRDRAQVLRQLAGYLRHVRPEADSDEAAGVIVVRRSMDSMTAGSGSKEVGVTRQSVLEKRWILVKGVVLCAANITSARCRTCNSLRIAPAHGVVTTSGTPGLDSTKLNRLESGGRL